MWTNKDLSYVVEAQDKRIAELEATIAAEIESNKRLSGRELELETTVAKLREAMKMLASGDVNYPERFANTILKEMDDES